MANLKDSLSIVEMSTIKFLVWGVGFIFTRITKNSPLEWMMVEYNDYLQFSTIYCIHVKHITFMCV